MKEIAVESGNDLKAIQDKIDLVKFKKSAKDLKIKEKNVKIEVENHVNKKDFEHNFHGISDFFVNIFGS